MYFQTVCNCSWFCFRTPTCRLTIVILLGVCEARYPPALDPISYKPLFSLGLDVVQPSCTVLSGLGWKWAQNWPSNKETLMCLHEKQCIGGLLGFRNALWHNTNLFWCCPFPFFLLPFRLTCLIFTILWARTIVYMLSFNTYFLYV